MVARPAHRGAAAESGLDALADAALALGSAGTLRDALRIVADAAARAARADVVVVRVANEANRRLDACAVVTGSAAVAAELEGSRFPLDELPEGEESELDRLPHGVRRAVERVGASSVVLLPVYVDGQARGSLELMRGGQSFEGAERQLARLSAAQVSLAIRAFGDDTSLGRGLGADAVLSVAGEALAAGADGSRTAEQVTRLAAEAAGAVGGLLWERKQDATLELIASFCLDAGDASLVNAGEAAERGQRIAAQLEAEERADAQSLRRVAGEHADRARDIASVRTKLRASAQGLFNVMILGIGALAANSVCPKLLQQTFTRDGVTDFHGLFLVPLAAAVSAAVALALFFHPPLKSQPAVAGTPAPADSPTPPRAG